MFAATKLRRGMIPKDKERGMWNIESQGKTMCHHHPWLFSFLLVEAVIGWQEDHYHAHACSHLHNVGTVLPTPFDHGCSSSSCRMGDKMFYHPLCGGSPPLSSANCRSVILFFPSTQITNFCLHALDCVLFSSIIADRSKNYSDFSH